MAVIVSLCTKMLSVPKMMIMLALCAIMVAGGYCGITHFQQMNDPVHQNNVNLSENSSKPKDSPIEEPQPKVMVMLEDIPSDHGAVEPIHHQPLQYSHTTPDLIHDTNEILPTPDNISSHSEPVTSSVSEVDPTSNSMPIDRCLTSTALKSKIKHEIVSEEIHICRFCTESDAAPKPVTLSFSHDHQADPHTKETPIVLYQTHSASNSESELGSNETPFCKDLHSDPISERILCSSPLSDFVLANSSESESQPQSIDVDLTGDHIDNVMICPESIHSNIHDSELVHEDEHILTSSNVTNYCKSETGNSLQSNDRGELVLTKSESCIMTGPFSDDEDDDLSEADSVPQHIDYAEEFVINAFNSFSDSEDIMGKFLSLLPQSEADLVLSETKPADVTASDAVAKQCNDDITVDGDCREVEVSSAAITDAEFLVTEIQEADVTTNDTVAKQLNDDVIVDCESPVAEDFCALITEPSAVLDSASDDIIVEDDNVTSNQQIERDISDPCIVNVQHPTQQVTPHSVLQSSIIDEVPALTDTDLLFNAEEAATIPGQEIDSVCEPVPILAQKSDHIDTLPSQIHAITLDPVHSDPSPMFQHVQADKSEITATDSPVSTTLDAVPQPDLEPVQPPCVVPACLSAGDVALLASATDVLIRFVSYLSDRHMLWISKEFTELRGVIRDIFSLSYDSYACFIPQRVPRGLLAQILPQCHLSPSLLNRRGHKMFELMRSLLHHPEGFDLKCVTIQTTYPNGSGTISVKRLIRDADSVELSSAELLLVNLNAVQRSAYNVDLTDLSRHKLGFIISEPNPGKHITYHSTTDNTWTKTEGDHVQKLDYNAMQSECARTALHLIYFGRSCKPRSSSFRNLIKPNRAL